MSLASLHIPKGFRFSGLHAGLKDSEEDLDLSLIVSEVPCRAVGVFTQNHFPGEPVKLGKERLKNGQLQALVINSKISNVATGHLGREMALNICDELAKLLKLDPSLCLISSTGIIGRCYPEGVIEAALPKAVQALSGSSENAWLAARGIMTTDTVPKAFSAKVGEASITVLVKGSGMIAPNMATMLAFIVTDADLENANLQLMLERVVNQSFNNISIDFDTSTSDTCLLLSNGQGGKVEASEFEQALTELCRKAAIALVDDGEGVTKIIDCQVQEALDTDMARAVASSIINSPLVKTMITGADPNWGRLIMAIGKTQREELSDVMPSISIAGVNVMAQGEPVHHDLAEISKKMKEQKQIEILVKLHLGNASARFYGGNLTNEYVHINADYTT
jgi:glutamate N-acetyltransferase/amino-acid N-acetyltransferase